MGMRICIGAVQVPFVRGGAEMLVESLRDALVERGHTVEVVALPFKWYPSRQVVSHALAWRLLDVTEAQGRPIDLFIPTKFPAYLARHPNKVTWLFHQFRQAYDLDESAFKELSGTPEDEWVKRKVRAMDAKALPESRAIHTIAQNVRWRLQRYNGVASTTLYPPPPLAERYHCSDYEPFVLSVGRLDAIKRVDLLLRALAVSSGGLRCVVAGTGPEEARLRALAKELGVDRRVEFAGFVSTERLLELYARCGMVYYAPYDEDYGFVTLEALRSSKPVVTADDSGGVLEFIRHGETGLVAAPRPEAVAAALDRLAQDPQGGARMGERGRNEVADISWDRVLEGLLATAT